MDSDEFERTMGPGVVRASAGADEVPVGDGPWVLFGVFDSGRVSVGSAPTDASTPTPAEPAPASNAGLRR